MKFYIADTHFGQDRAAYFDRVNEPERTFPFSDDTLRTDAIVERWNSVVGLGDDVYLVGDVGLLSRGIDWLADLMSGLRGRKHIVVGNHDNGVKTMQKLMSVRKSGIVEVCDYKVVKDGGQRVVLSHYPIAFWEGQHSGWFHFYGHVHNCVEEDYFTEFGQMLVERRRLPEFRAVNVGAVMMDYRPVTLDEVVTGFHFDTKIDFKKFEEEHRGDGAV